MVQWTKNFMMNQGYDLETLIKEDNQSTMLLMKNGKLSSGKRMKHIDIWYFYVLFNRGVIKVSEMIADFFTKPLQGTHFDKMRDIVLNMDLEDSIVEHRSMLENKDWECSTIWNL